MSLIPWKHRNDLAWPFEKLFEGFLPRETESQPTAWLPAMDVQETDKDFQLRVELPGVDPEKVEVTVDGNMLTLRGEKKDVRESNDKGFQRTECVFGAFERSLLLPEGVDLQNVTAEGAQGVLQVRIPKVPAAAAKRIQVKAK